MNQEIRIRAEGSVVTVTFNRLERKNSITAAMYANVTAALTGAASDRVVRAVVLEGDESIFTAGNDMGDFLRHPGDGEHSPAHAFMLSLANFPKPLIAAVCGPAIGIGTTMLLHCDLVYAGDNAMFSMPFVDLGLCPEAGSSLLVPRMFGHHRAAAALLLGEPLNAQSAFEAGLVNKILPAGEVKAFAQQQARKAAAKPLSSLMETKRLMKQGQAAEVLRQIDDEGVSFARMLAEPAAKEAISAFLAKRKPDFSML
ncbi:enoyl-CoA hydratase [Ramlibacter sp. WS9]|uniref:enoyl-CoA hydratase n=1 Tax=Ramlibacter sp. WS9 TaxID=1882741 RepID=UPI0011442BEC|nr:enoyl-CoA hydratase [Ramlibacter sp. WS9]ROZ75780.1 enoyl-CoA hydratase [Ramlibacter sp. WS9]